MKITSTLLLSSILLFALLQANSNASVRSGSFTFMTPVAGNLASHHRDIVIILAPGEVRQMQLPDTHGPIYVMHNNSAGSILEGDVIAVDPTTGEIRRPDNTNLFRADDKIMIDPNGPNGEQGFFVYNKTLDEAITFRASLLY